MGDFEFTLLQSFAVVIFYSVYDVELLGQCSSTFLLPRNPTQASSSLTEPHALIRESSDICEIEATGCLWTHFPSRALTAEPSRGRQSRQRWPIKNFNALVDSSMLLYLTKHVGRGSRRRPFCPATNIENLSLGCPRKRQTYVSFRFCLAEFLENKLTK